MVYLYELTSQWGRVFPNCSMTQEPSRPKQPDITVNRTAHHGANQVTGQGRSPLPSERFSVSVGAVWCLVLGLSGPGQVPAGFFLSCGRAGFSSPSPLCSTLHGAEGRFLSKR